MPADLGDKSSGVSSVAADVAADFKKQALSALVAIYSHDRDRFKSAGGDWIKHLLHQGLAQLSDQAGQFGGLIEGLAGSFTEQEAGQLYDAVAAQATKGTSE